ncbi:CD3324 family protein [Paenibacillus wynnii]|uniref:CD3324 family protein n=1 Tax=Paenibacillus wynnii TaxID=268407 RepID=UPI0027918CCE|nr:CD3324 family protein [Paenibacillus wynnii]MDQ0192709.1 Mor family transcriptional regulator [Paenibacillus wynnii]
MSYVNGKDVLPPGLLEELQGYIQGELLYIPRKTEQRVKWGENSGSRKEIANRNEEIFCSYRSGSSLPELQQKYHLSEESLRKIISKMRLALNR